MTKIYAVAGWLVCACAAVGIARGQATEVVLHNFAGALRGANPTAGVIRDFVGNLYGTANSGGAAGAGVVYKVDTMSHERILYSFTGGADGAYPYSGVIYDSAGNLYGTTLYEGAVGSGVVYKLDPAGNETVIYSFTGFADGGNPYAGVIRDSAGNLYGTTFVGGTVNAGVVYKLDPAGQATVLHSFTGDDGDNPYAGVIRDSAGNLYGTTWRGGASGAGVVYRLDPAGQETVLYNFSGGADGGNPYAGVIRDSAGNLYGTTNHGGSANAGVVYKLDAAGHYTVLYSFTSGADGSKPQAGVVRDAVGNLYGTTPYGGKWSAGVIFELIPQ